MQGVEFTAAFAMQVGCQAGTPAGGSDGSWIQAQSADASGTTYNGITPTTRGVLRRNSCQHLQGDLLRSCPRAGLRLHLRSH
eukprot:631255-Pyramimonas_sp.AAC.1